MNYDLRIGRWFQTARIAKVGLGKKWAWVPEKSGSKLKSGLESVYPLPGRGATPQNIADQANCIALALNCFTSKKKITFHFFCFLLLPCNLILFRFHFFFYFLLQLLSALSIEQLQGARLLGCESYLRLILRCWGNSSILCQQNSDALQDALKCFPDSPNYS